MTQRAAEELITKSVRRVLIDTVGGDGLYVVREISELFELAARSAITFSALVLDTLEDPDAPWRDEIAEKRKEPPAS